MTEPVSAPNSLTDPMKLEAHDDQVDALSRLLEWALTHARYSPSSPAMSIFPDR